MSFYLMATGRRKRRRTSPRGQRLSAILHRLAEVVEDRIRLAELSGTFGDRAFGALLLVFALPNLLPLPPGTSTILGVPLILIAAQLAIGRSELWLPRAVGNRSLSKSDLQRVVAYGVPALRRTERLLAPRFEVFLSDRLIGSACLLLAIILVLPIPFCNMPPAFAICAFALGLLQRDGLAVLVAWLATAISLAVAALVSGAVILAAKTAFEAVASFLGG